MYDHLVIFTTPAISGERSVYPIVRISCVATQNSRWFSSVPVALLIEESGQWYFSKLDEGISEDILLQANPV